MTEAKMVGCEEWRERPLWEGLDGQFAGMLMKGASRPPDPAPRDGHLSFALGASLCSGHHYFPNLVMLLTPVQFLSRESAGS